jgi:hypothetical protein
MEKGYLKSLVIAILVTSIFCLNQYGPMCPISMGTIVTGFLFLIQITFKLASMEI